MSIFSKVADLATSIFPPARIAKDIIGLIAGGDKQKEQDLAAMEPAIAQAIIARDAQRDAQINETMRTEIQGRVAMVQAEMKSGDRVTRWARPSIVYSGILMFGTEFGIRVWAFIHGIDWPEGTLVPEPMIYSWTAVSSIWAVGRSAEKIQSIKNGGDTPKSKLMKVLTG